MKLRYCIYKNYVLIYATPALLLKVRQVSELNVCWNMVIRKIFGYHKWESVRTLTVWAELMLHALYSCVRLHSIGESLTI